MPPLCHTKVGKWTVHSNSVLCKARAQGPGRARCQAPQECHCTPATREQQGTGGTGSPRWLQHRSGHLPPQWPGHCCKCCQKRVLILRERARQVGGLGGPRRSQLKPGDGAEAAPLQRLRSWAACQGQQGLWAPEQNFF